MTARAYDDRLAERCARAIDRLGRRLHVELAGLENLPKGRALLVANHAFGFDVAFAISRIRCETGRRVFVLGEHLWWRVPAVRRLAAAVGIVDGTQENADRLLGAGELVLVLPGGLREAVKPRELRYRLLWGHRYGFVRAAVRNGAPLVPLASLGADELFTLTGDAFARGRRLGLGLPVPRPRWVRPRGVALRYVVGEPIPIERDPSAADDPHYLRRLRREIEGSLHELFEEGFERHVCKTA